MNRFSVRELALALFAGIYLAVLYAVVSCFQ